MSGRFKAKLLLAKNFVSTKIGLDAFQEPPEIVQRKKDLKNAEVLYNNLELRVRAFISTAEANEKASTELTKFVMNFSEEGQTARQRDAFKLYGENFVKLDQSTSTWVLSMKNMVWTPIRATQQDIRHAKGISSMYFEEALEVEHLESKVKEMKSKQSPKLGQAEKELADATTRRDKAAREFIDLVSTIYDRRLVEILQVFNSLIATRKQVTDESAAVLGSLHLFVPERFEVERYNSLIQEANRMTVNFPKPIDFSDENFSTANEDLLPSRYQSIYTDISTLSDYPLQANPESARSSIAYSKHRSARMSMGNLRERKAIRFVRAIYAFVGTEEGEISFNAGDKIAVLMEDECGWWVGEINGVIGVFPQNYTEFE